MTCSSRRIQSSACLLWVYQRKRKKPNISPDPVSLMQSAHGFVAPDIARLAQLQIKIQDPRSKIQDPRWREMQVNLNWNLLARFNFDGLWTRRRSCQRVCKRESRGQGLCKICVALSLVIATLHTNLPDIIGTTSLSGLLSISSSSSLPESMSPKFAARVRRPAFLVEFCK